MSKEYKKIRNRLQNVMEGLHITRKIQIDVSYSADEWDLYTGQSGANAAAMALNQALMTAVNEGLPRQKVNKAVYAVMRKYASTGASDSEPMRHLERVLDKIFGKTDNW